MDEDLDGFTSDELAAEVIRLRTAIRAHRDSSGHDLCWHHPEGREMEKRDWENAALSTFGMQFFQMEGRTPSSLLILFHADGDRAVDFRLPPLPAGFHWVPLLDTAETEDPRTVQGGYPLEPLSMAVLEARSVDD